MAKSTTTDEPVETKAADKPLPEDQGKPADDQADDSSSKPDTPKEEGSEPEKGTKEGKSEDKPAEEAKPGEELPSSEEDIEAWAVKRGLSLDDPKAIAKQLRDTQRKLHEKGQEKQPEKLRSEMADQQGKQAEGATEETKEARKLLSNLAVLEFYISNPEARQYDGKMAEIVKEKPHLGGDFETLYTLAKSRTSAEELDKARKEGEKSALKSANQSQRQGSPEMSASKQGKSGDSKEDPFLKGFDQDY